MKRRSIIIPAMTVLLSGALIGCGNVQAEESENIVLLEPESSFETRGICRRKITEKRKRRKWEHQKISVL